VQSLAQSLEILRTAGLLDRVEALVVTNESINLQVAPATTQAGPRDLEKEALETKLREDELLYASS
jgi:hypothetical protein